MAGARQLSRNDQRRIKNAEARSRAHLGKEMVAAMEVMERPKDRDKKQPTRKDCVAMLEERGTISGDDLRALRKLERKMLLTIPNTTASWGEGGGGGEGAPGQTPTRVQAAGWCARISMNMRPKAYDLMVSLLAAKCDIRWRVMVEYFLGETNPQAQAGALRAACSELQWAIRREQERMAA